MREIIFLNLLFIIILRFLIKKNIFSNFVGYFSIFLQASVLISFPFRERNFSSLWSNQELIICLFLFISLTPFLPYIINFLLSNKRILILGELEDKISNFILDLLYKLQNFCKIRFFFYDKIETIFIKNLTKIVLKFLIFEELIFLLFFGIPFLVFIYFFYLALYFQDGWAKAFVCWVYCFFFHRILSISLFLVKNYLWNNFNNFLLNLDKELYFNVIGLVDYFFLNKSLLTALVFDKNLNNSGTSNQLASFWKNLKHSIHLFILYAIVKNCHQNFLPKVRKIFGWLTFLSISLGIAVFYSKIFGFFYFFLIYFISPYTFRNILTKVDIFDKKLFVFLQDISLFHSSIEERLILENNSKIDTSYLIYSNLKMPKSFLKKVPFSKIFLLFFLFSLFFSFIWFDYYNFLHYAIYFLK